MEGLTDYGIRRLALILSVQAEIEGMKVKNREREAVGNAPAYGETAFLDKANELQNLAYGHDEQIFG